MSTSVQLRRARLGANVCAVALVAACGARSSLDAGDPERDASATTSVGSGGWSGAGGGGAGGASPLPCELLLVDGPPRTAVDELDVLESEAEPSLVLASNARAMLLHTRRGDTAEAGVLRAASFEPWGSWPSDLGPARGVANGLREGMVATRGFAQDAAVAIPLYGLGRSGATTPVFAPSVQHDTTYADVPYTYLGLGGVRGRATALATGSAHVLLAWTYDFGEEQTVQLLLDAAGGVVAGPWPEAGCATTPVRSAALAMEGGFLSAVSSGRSGATCGLDDRISVQARWLLTSRWNVGEAAPAIASELEAAEPYLHVALVPRPGGAWLVSQTDGSTTRAMPAVLAHPLDAQGQVAGSPVRILEEGRSFGPLGVTSFGSGFAVAWHESNDDFVPFVGVRVFDQRGEMQAESFVDPSPWALGDGRLSLASSPAGVEPPSILVAWQSSARRVAAARLRCQVALP